MSLERDLEAFLGDRPSPRKHVRDSKEELFLTLKIVATALAVAISFLKLMNMLKPRR